MNLLHEPLVSIIIPTYNRKVLLKRAIESVLKQTYSNIEIIVIDDGSTDNSISLVDEFNDKRIRYECINHSGAPAARNRGIKLARGKYIAFLDSDDIYLEDKISSQLNQLHESKSDLVFCSFVRDIEGKEETIPTNLDNGYVVDASDLLKGNFISTQTIFGKKRCFQNTKFDESLPRFQDWDLAIRLASKYKITYFNNVYVRQYIQEDSIYYNKDAYVNGMLKIIVKNIDQYILKKKTLKNLLINVISQTEDKKL